MNTEGVISVQRPVRETSGTFWTLSLGYLNFCLAVIYGIGELHCPVLECALKIPGQEFFQAVAGNDPCSEGGNVLEKHSSLRCFVVVMPLEVLIFPVTIWHSLQFPAGVSQLIPVWKIFPYLTLISDPSIV